MKRLLCLLSSMNTGGAETFLMKVYRCLDRSKYQMDFCVHVAEHCDYEDEILQLGGRFFRIPSKSSDANRFQKQLFQLIRDNQYQNVLKITSNAAGFWDLKIAKKAGAIHTVARSSNSEDGGGLKQQVAHRLGRILWMRYVDVMLAPSDLAARYTFGAKAFQDGRVQLLNNGLDLDCFHFLPEERAKLRAELGAGENTPVLGHVGRFNPQKNHKFLIRVFEAFHSKDPNALLVLVGVGDLEAEIRQQVLQAGLSNYVRFMGLRQDIPALLSAFDVFVFPSLYEGMPNTVIEAQACALPCVLSNQITSQANLSGRLRYMPLTEPEAWANEIENVLLSGRVPVKMEAYDIHAVAEQFCRICYSGAEEELV